LGRIQRGKNADRIHGAVQEADRKVPGAGVGGQDIQDRENLAWCKEQGIRLNGPKLGRPPRDRQAYLEALELERQESGERNEIEGCIGVCKRRYGLDLVMTRLKHSSEVDIHVSILTRNLFKRLKSLLGLVLGWIRRAGLGRKTEDGVLLGCVAA
jgi:hypothetical protein